MISWFGTRRRRQSAKATYTREAAAKAKRDADIELEEQKKSASGETEKRQQEAQAKALQDSRAHAKANVVEVVGDKMREPRWCFMCNANSKQNSPGKQSSHRRRSGLREGRRKPRSCQ